MRQITISAYEAWTNKEGKAMPGCKPYDTDFYTEMLRIRNGFYKSIVEQCRSIKNKDERNKFKCEKLPSVTISAVCKGWRKLENVAHHTGLLNLDIDLTGNEHVQDWGELRDLIFQRPLVVCAFLSASGKGLSFVVKVNPEEHKDVFFSIVDECKEHLGIKIDAALHDIVRLRFVSYDPDMKIREDFDTVPVCRPSPVYLSNKKNYGGQNVSMEPIGAADSAYNFNEAVKRTEQMYQFVEGQKHVYLTSLAGGCNIMGMSQQYCEQSVLNKYSKLTDISTNDLLKPVKNVYRTYKSQHGTFGTKIKHEYLNKKILDILLKKFIHEGLRPTEDDIVNIAKENDANIERVHDVLKRAMGEYEEEFGFNKFPLIKKVEVWLHKQWKFSFNVVTGQAEQMSLGNCEFKPVNHDEIYRQLHLNNLKFSLNNVKSLFKSDYVKTYDPIEQYFKELDTWDGQDYIGLLSSHIHLSDKEFFENQFKKTLVRCIPCGLGIKENRIVLVLRSEKQSTGKTTFIRFLSPWGIKKYYTESPVLKGDKDSEFRFSENFIYNLEELAALNNHDIERLKAVISKRNIKERRAYDIYEQEKARRCNFFASTNQDVFLQEFENTRWMVFDIESVNWDYSKNIDIRKVWSQAWYLYNNGFEYELSVSDREEQAKRNEKFRIPMNEEELIVRHYKPCSAGDIGCCFYTATQISGWLGMKYGIKLSSRGIGRVIKKIFNMERSSAWIDGNAVYGYYMIRTDESRLTEETPF